MKDTFVIGITGAGGAGKDTVGQLLGYHMLAFAGPLKQGLAAMGFPEPSNRVDKEALIPGYSFSWRQAAQTLGTEWGRSLQPDIWLAIIKSRVEHSMWNRVAITDVRFHNEADWVREHGLLVHVKGRATTIKEDDRKHASEHGLIAQPKDYVINNIGTLDQLRVDVLHLQQYINAAHNVG